jgi:hypothetical protein
MTQEEIRKYLWEKWSNYSWGLAISYSFRKNKDLTIGDVKDAFESGFYEFQQICYKNNIKMEDLKLD